MECVPNFSEGRNRDVVDAIAAAFTSTPGVALLDTEMDAAHNRCVISAAGDPDGVVRGIIKAVGKAVELIDLRTHKGEHPRMGAADVIPFIPISGVTMQEASFRSEGDRSLRNATVFRYISTTSPHVFRPARILHMSGEDSLNESGKRSARIPTADPISVRARFILRQAQAPSGRVSP